jgi:hypothetical protein
MDKVDRLKKKVKEKKEEKVTEELQEQAKVLGIKEIVEDWSETDASTPTIVHMGKNGSYRVDDQQFALMFLEVFQGEDKDGNLIPKYANVGKMLGIPRNTLHDWWRKREEIQAQQSTLMSKGMDYISTGMMVEMIRMLKSLGNVDYDDMIHNSSDMKNFIQLMNMMTNKIRLFTNQSTSNVAHAHQVEMVIPED